MAQGTEDTRLVDLLHTPLEAVAGERQRLIVFNPPGTYRPPEGVREATLVQPFRPAFLQLEASGLHVRPVAEGQGHDVALVALGRHRARNEQMLSQAATRLAPGGLLVAAGFKADGAASLRKRLADALPGVEHVARHHGVVMWLRPDEPGMTLLRGLEPASTDGPEDFVTGPGVFSQDRVDPASRLLVEALPDRLGGRVADFGAGWGYLSVALARRYGDRISRIDLYEADHHALEAARANMTALVPATAAGFLWIDVRREPLERIHDVVVMNPPFHEGRAAEPSIGLDFIRSARAALKPGGRLYLVANRGLPYEAALEAAFARHGEIVRDKGYKVLSAQL